MYISRGNASYVLPSESVPLESPSESPYSNYSTVDRMEARKA